MARYSGSVFPQPASAALFAAVPPAFPGLRAEPVPRNHEAARPPQSEPPPRASPQFKLARQPADSGGGLRCNKALQLTRLIPLLATSTGC
jgi:hypothetical protein